MEGAISLRCRPVSRLPYSENGRYATCNDLILICVSFRGGRSVVNGTLNLTRFRPDRQLGTDPPALIVR